MSLLRRPARRGRTEGPGTGSEAEKGVLDRLGALRGYVILVRCDRHGHGAVAGCHKEPWIFHEQLDLLGGAYHEHGGCVDRAECGMDVLLVLL